MTTTTLHADDVTMCVLNEMLERTTRGVASSAQEINRHQANLTAFVTRKTHPGESRTDTERLQRMTARTEEHLAHAKEIHAYQERVLRALHGLLKQEV